jgi:hypothetical protein
VFFFAGLALVHLHCIHSEFFHAWDPTFKVHTTRPLDPLVKLPFL